MVQDYMLISSGNLSETSKQEIYKRTLTNNLDKNYSLNITNINKIRHSPVKEIPVPSDNLIKSVDYLDLNKEDKIIQNLNVNTNLNNNLISTNVSNTNKSFVSLQEEKDKELNVAPMMERPKNNFSNNYLKFINTNNTNTNSNTNSNILNNSLNLSRANPLSISLDKDNLIKNSDKSVSITLEEEYAENKLN